MTRPAAAFRYKIHVHPDHKARYRPLKVGKFKKSESGRAELGMDRTT
jgi:hypothetical protein